MNSERQIIFRLRESRVDEAYPKILNRLSSSTRKRIGDIASRIGIDLQNEDYSERVITSNRDPILNTVDKSVLLIFELDTGDIAVTADGYWPSNPKIDGTWSSDIPRKYFLNHVVRTIVITPTNKSAGIADKRKGRRDAQAGAIALQRKKNVSAFDIKYGYMDKSGYALRPDKYKDMLAKANLKNGDQILKDLSISVSRLAQALSSNPDILNDDAIYKEYKQLNDEYLGLVRDLNTLKQGYDKSGGNSSTYGLQSALKKAQEFIRRANSLYRKF